MSKLGLVCVTVLALAGVACGGDDEAGGSGGASGAGAGGVGGAAGTGGELNKCQIQAARATNECMASVPMLGDTAACMGTSLCVAECAENATCADIMMAGQFQGPVVACTINCFTGGMGDDPLCDAQTMRAQTECGIGAVDGGLPDAGAPPIDVPCNGAALCVAQCSQSASCAELQQAAMDNTGPFATCSQTCLTMGGQQ